ncbi:MAG TPA: nucleotidyltransferase family protein, partial [Pseudogracilibacillus sp.]|nr:nucleotidyltransferase family protein [Pseudogracilibacillus sp.]
CFGSESGNISDFITSYNTLKEKNETFKRILKKSLNDGYSFPEASKEAYRTIGLTTNSLDLSKPNNILGFSYVKTILDADLTIRPLTIKRIKSDYHDQEINGKIASATSIRKQLLNKQNFTADKISISMPKATLNQLHKYKDNTGIWHDWEKYFHLVYYRVLTMTPEELASIYGIDEGIEHRIIKSVKNATSLNDWIKTIKTKRYTWTRIQRMFVHILTNTKKEELQMIKKLSSVPYIRLLGITKTGRAYLNSKKKEIDIPIISSLKKNLHPLLKIEERATNAYYSIFSPEIRKKLHAQELQAPIILNNS